MDAIDKAGRGCLTVFFLIFAVVGIGLTAAMLHFAARTAAPWFWTRTSCEILSAAGKLDRNAADTSDAYSLSASYRYHFGGRVYTSGTVSGKDPGEDEWEDVERQLARHPAGSQSWCYVNPGAPDQAVLEREIPWPVLFVLLPLTFAAVGIGGLIGTWRGSRKRPGADSISAKASSRTARVAARWAYVVLGAGLLLAGSTILLVVLGKPILRLATSGGWQPAEATVEFSRVRRHEGDDSTSYSADVLYRYEFSGRQYRSSRYGLMESNSWSYRDATAAVNGLSPGTRVRCHVNPADPLEAALDTSFPLLLLLGLIPLSLAVIGLLLLKHHLPRLGQPVVTGEGRVAVGAAPPPSLMPVSSGALELRPHVSSTGRFLGCSVFALFWNGIVAVFVYQIGRDWLKGEGEWLPTVFLTPFVLIGLGGIGGMVYSFLGLFSPKPRLVLSPGTLALGSSSHLEWSLSRNSRAIRSVQVWLTGTEEVVYRRGDDSATDRNEFFRQSLVDAPGPLMAPAGTTTLAVPGGTMHSLESPHNRIIWALQVKAKLAGWPDISEEFRLRVEPQSGPASAAGGERPW